MKTDPYTPPSSPAGEGNISSSYSVLVSVLSWLQWSILTIFILLIYTFAYRINPDKNHWALDLTGVIILAILLPLSIFFGVFLFKKLSNPWLRLIVYGVGLFGVFMLIACGFFAVLSGDHILVILGIIGLILHCPLINKKANKSLHPTANRLEVDGVV
jgi:hypothetical protein